MVLVIVTHVEHHPTAAGYMAYMPYVREMNIWARHASRVIVVAPLAGGGRSGLLLPYDHSQVELVAIPAFDVKGWGNALRALCLLPLIAFRIGQAMGRADHIHLRCPGNVGLVGCVMQVFFPRKRKTAKYAGNWDPQSEQPWSYRLQRWLLSNTFLTRRMRVLVYGDWKDAGPNIKPFFTASYRESDIVPVKERSFDPPLKMVFAGMLVPGKMPMYAVRMAEAVNRSHPCRLLIFGEGPEREPITRYIKEKNLSGSVVLCGNQDAAVVAEAYQDSHFTILPSRSEGWPKAIAEGMFWGCIPLATPVSCLPSMLADGARGVLLSLDIEKDTAALSDLLRNPERALQMSAAAAAWSRQFTMDRFEAEIRKLLSP